MCGIVGLWNLDGAPIEQKLLDRFTDTLAHRGPDGRGTYIDQEASIGLGHRRLAILDLSEAGRQPMTYAGGRFWITFNGEIYNFLELRSQLADHGYQFTSDTDTEVILAGYLRWGEDFQLRLNGMWAFAIWDSQERRLFLSRDRFGVKPLLYYFDGKRFAFASEMKAFLALDWLPVLFDPDTLSQALTAHHLVEGTEHCLVRDLRRLPGGFSLTVRGGEQPVLRRWWNTLEHLETAPRSYDDQVSRYRELFLDACRLRMRSDVPIGTALSGGLDSSSVLCGMHLMRKGAGTHDRLAQDWQRAFVATYPGAVEDERTYAEEVVRHTGVRPVFCEILPEMLLEYFDEILFQFEEISDIHIGPWLVYKAQRDQNVLVSIDGHGGDESLGGYYWHINAAARDTWSLLSLPGRLRELNTIMREYDPFSDQLARQMPSYKMLLFQSARRLLRRVKQRLLGANRSRQSEALAFRINRPDTWLLHPPRAFASPGFAADVEAVHAKDELFKELYKDFHYFSLPTNLRDYDRLSMAHGVEVRSPFLDWRLACYAFSLPSSSIIGGGFTKRVLRDAMKGILPEAIRTRKGKGAFANPSGEWLARNIEEYVRDVTGGKAFQESSVWNGKLIVDQLDSAFRTQAYDKIQRAWTFVQAARLMESFQDRARVLRDKGRIEGTVSRSFIGKTR